MSSFCFRRFKAKKRFLEMKDMSSPQIFDFAKTAPGRAKESGTSPGIRVWSPRTKRAPAARERSGAWLERIGPDAGFRLQAPQAAMSDGQMPYRYEAVIHVTIIGNGIQADGDGATATANRLARQIGADPRVIKAFKGTIKYVGRRGAMSDSRYDPSAAVQAASARFNALPREVRVELAPLLEHYRQLGVAEALDYVAGTERALRRRIDAFLAHEPLA
jgi:hypothetical protein